MEYPVVKINISELDKTDFQKTNPAVYAISWDDIQLEFLVNRKLGNAKAVIFGTGHFDRSIWGEIPYFARHSWANKLDATCIYYADPSIHLTPALSLLWCYGRNDDWYLERIAVALLKILNRLGIRVSDTLFYGSSGGGFTAIALATLLGSRATAINPQLLLENYNPNHMEAFKRVCLREGEELIPERTDVVKLFQREGYCPRLRLMENTASRQDMTAQFLPFLQEVGAAGLGMGFLRFTGYFHEGGHNGMPSTPECLEGIRADLNENFTPPKDGTSFLRRIVGTAEGLTTNDNLIWAIERMREWADKDCVSMKIALRPEWEGKIQFAYYLTRGAKTLAKRGYVNESLCVFSNLEPGEYRIKYFLRYGELKKSYLTAPLTVTANGGTTADAAHL